jgi:predicted alpha/beta-fold hydrolase
MPTLLSVNPLAGQRRAHSSSVRFARTDVWVRDIRQVIDDAIARSQPSNGQVTLIGYSLGALRVGRTLHQATRSFPKAPVVPLP